MRPYGGLDTLSSYGAQYRQDWASAIPDAHWEFFKRTVRIFETAFSSTPVWARNWI